MAELLQAGLNLTIVGLTVVFVLLTSLVGAINLVARFCRLFDAPAAAETAAAAAAEADAEVAGAIAAAVQMFRRDRRGATP